MSAAINNGGAAFPIPQQADQQGNVLMWAEPGMTLRDYFAAKAMQEMLHGSVLPDGFDATAGMALLAKRAYEAADAMVKAKAGQA